MTIFWQKKNNCSKCNCQKKKHYIEAFVVIKLVCLSFRLCFCFVLSVGKVGLRKIAVLWDQYDADTSLALSKNLYQAKTHLQEGVLGGSNGSHNHFITLVEN